MQADDDHALAYCWRCGGAIEDYSHGHRDSAMRGEWTHSRCSNNTTSDDRTVDGFLAEVSKLLANDSTAPVSIDTAMGWGKHKLLSYRAAAQQDPGYLKWAATKIGGTRGQLCAEALALYLGVTE